MRALTKRILLISCFLAILSFCINAQTTIQVGLGLRESKVTAELRTTNNNGLLDRPTQYFPFLGLYRKIADDWLIGFGLDYHIYEGIFYYLPSETGGLNTSSINFTQYRIHPRLSWQPLPHWRLSLGPEVSAFSRFRRPTGYFPPTTPRPDTEPHFRMQYGLMGGVGFQLDRILLQLNYDWGIAFRNQVVQSIKPISAIDLKLIYEQPLGKKEKRR